MWWSRSSQAQLRNRLSAPLGALRGRQIGTSFDPPNGFCSGRRSHTIPPEQDRPVLTMPIAQLLPVTRVSVRPPQRVEATQHDHASAFGHSRRSGRAAMIPDLPSTTDFG